MIVVVWLDQGAASRNQTRNQMYHRIKDWFAEVGKNHGDPNWFWDYFYYLYAKYRTPSADSVKIWGSRDSSPSPSKRGTSSLS